MEKVIPLTVEWLKEETKKAHAKGLLVGISGGLDSAVIANLIKQAFPNHSLGVIMPLHNHPEDIADAEATTKAANIETMTVDLTATHQVLYNDIRHTLKSTKHWNEASNRVSDANLRARLRMSTLYTIAAQMNYLVVGTDNAAEWYTGYFTKYGDGGVDLQPIIQWTKREVRRAATLLHVPNTVIEKRPSADLWAGQSDEAELGTNYDYIDDYLEGKTIPDKDKQIIERLHKNTVHKRKIATQFLYR